MRGLLWITIPLLMLATGCRSSDRLESELRVRDTELREVREELDRCQAYTNAMTLELKALRGEVAFPANGAGPPVMVYPVRSLTLGRQTGGRDGDSTSGDTALQVVLEPRDAENQTVRVPASAIIHAIEVNNEGLKRKLSSWEIPQEELRRSWRNGLLSTGYILLLPWKVLPTTPKLRIIAVLQMDDGRVFEADRDITIRVPKALPSTLTMPPAATLAPPLAETPGADSLPLPKKELPLPLPPPAPVPSETKPPAATLEAPTGPEVPPPGPSTSTSSYRRPASILDSPPLRSGPLSPIQLIAPMVPPQEPGVRMLAPVPIR